MDDADRKTPHIEVTIASPPDSRWTRWWAEHYPAPIQESPE